MKKFYAIAAAALLGLSANAQNGADLFITGQSAAADEGGFAMMWTVGPNADKFNWDGNEYTLDVAGLSSFTICKAEVAEGDWEGWKENALTCDYGDVPGVAVALTAGGANILTPWQGDYHIVVAADLSTITLTTTTPEPPMAFYLRGDMNGWLNDGMDAAWQFEQYADKTYRLLANGKAILAGEAFKVADAGWAKINYGSDGNALMMDTDTELFFNASANCTLEEEWDGVCYFNLTTHEVFFSNDVNAQPEWLAGVESVAAENGEAVYFNLQGVQVSEPANGLFIVVRDGKAVKVIK